jgi:phosphohistidine phosphatase
MKLYLVQHGDSLPEEVNPERPLSGRGQEDVRRLAEFVGERGIHVQRMYHSGKLRARQTAELLATRIASAEGIQAVAGLNPNDPVEPIAIRISGWAEDALLVGHLPFMGRLVAYLTAGASDRHVTAFTPGSVVCLEPDPGGRWAVAWMLRPEVVGGWPR